MEDEGLSLKDIYNIIMKKKFYLIISFLIFFIAILIGIYGFYNKINEGYELNVSYSWYGIENNNYANGKRFNYYDIISKSNIKQVKDSDDKYSDIDVERLAESLSIKKDKEEYLIKVSNYNFPNKNIAKDFLYELIHLPYQEALSLSFDYEAYLKAYDDASKIISKINYLEKQMSLLITGYSDLIDNFGDINVLGSSIRSKLEEVEVYNLNHPLDQYKFLAYKNTYLTEEEYKFSQQEIAYLDTLRTQLLASKNQLYQTVNTISGKLDIAVTNYYKALYEIDYNIINVEQRLSLLNQVSSGNYSAAESKIFLDKLTEHKSNISDLTKIYTETLRTVINDTTLINVNEYKPTGQIGIVSGALISFIAALFLGLAISLFLGFIDKKN